MKFIHAADIHLDSPLRGLERYEGAPVDRIRDATRQALTRLVDLALAEPVDMVLLAGDIFDGDWKDYNTGLFFARQMSRLREGGIKVFLICGNHDAASQISKHLRLPDHVRALSDKRPETVRLEDLGVAIHGMGFSKRAVPEDLSSQYPDPLPGFFNIGLLHTSATGRPGHEVYAPCTLEGLRSKGYDYWALGHIHAREVLNESPWIVFPGNIQGRHIRETGAKGCSLVVVEEGRVRSVEHHELDVLRWVLCEVDAAGAADAPTVVDHVGAALAEAKAANEGLPLAVRIELRGACAAHAQLSSNPDKWIAEIRATATDLGDLWIEKVKLHTSYHANLDEILARQDPLARLLRTIHSLDAEPALLEQWMDDLADFRRKLPPELRQGELGLDLDNPDKRRELIDEIKQMLLPRLLSIAR